MHYTTPPASPYSPSPPVTPRSGVPLLLQAANRSSKSPSRSSTFHYPSSSSSLPPTPIEPVPSLSQRPPPPMRASTAPSFMCHQDLSFPAPPPLPLAAPPFRHARVGSQVPRYALEDVVVRNELPTLSYDHTREFSDGSTYYDENGVKNDTKLVVNKEGFLENEVKPIRGFWSRWFRGMVILLVFLSIITGIVIGVSEYYDSKHRESNAEAEGTGGGGTTISSSIGTASSLSSSLAPSTSGGATVSSTSESPSTSLRMRTTLRTTSTSPASTSTDRSSSTQSASTHLQVTLSTEAPTVTSTSSTSHSDPTSTDDSDPAESTDVNQDDPSTSSDTSEDSTETTGRLFGLASATGTR